MPAEESKFDKLLTPAETAALWKVDPKTVTRWAKAGKITSIRTLGGHRRYREAEVMALINRPDPAPETGISTLWAAVVTGHPATAKKKLREARIATVAQLVEHSADDLAEVGIEGDVLAAVRLALAKKGLALHGEVLGKVALRPAPPRHGSGVAEAGSG